MHPDHREAYEYTIADMKASLGCPQCRALELLRAVIAAESPYQEGQRAACRAVVRLPHECGKQTRMVYLAADGQHAGGTTARDRPSRA